MTRRAFTQAYHRVRLWIRQHGAWPAERDVRACDWVAFECLYQRQVAVMDGEPGTIAAIWDRKRMMLRDPDDENDPPDRPR